MDNTQAISAIQGRLTILTSEDSANAQEEAALNAALTILQNGYQSDMATATAAVAAETADLNSQIATLTAQVSTLQVQVNAANAALSAANLPTV